MQPVNLFQLASQQANWLSVRQTAVASNIANANTPGYGAVDVLPFEAVLNKKTTGLAATHPKHIHHAAMQTFTADSKDDSPMMPSGNTVVLEEELMKSGQVRRDMEMNTAIVKAFHRMLMMTTRPG